MSRVLKALVASRFGTNKASSNETGKESTTLQPQPQPQIGSRRVKVEQEGDDDDYVLVTNTKEEHTDTNNNNASDSETDPEIRSLKQRLKKLQQVRIPLPRILSPSEKASASAVSTGGAEGKPPRNLSKATTTTRKAQLPPPAEDDDVFDDQEQQGRNTMNRKPPQQQVHHDDPSSSAWKDGLYDFDTLAERFEAEMENTNKRQRSVGGASAKKKEKKVSKKSATVEATPAQATAPPPPPPKKTAPVAPKQPSAKPDTKKANKKSNTPSKPKAPPCQYFMAGYCRDGAKCKNSHFEGEGGAPRPNDDADDLHLVLQQIARAEAQQQRQRRNTHRRQESNDYYTEDFDDEEEVPRRTQQQGPQHQLDLDNMTYEQILALQEKLGEAYNPNLLTREQLQRRLPVVVFKEDTESSPTTRKKHEAEEDTTQTTCTVCLDTYSDGDLVIVLPCFHRLHEDCGLNWLVKKNLCPVCKFDVRDGGSARAAAAFQ